MSAQVQFVKFNIPFCDELSLQQSQHLSNTTSTGMLPDMVREVSTTEVKPSKRHIDWIISTICHLHIKEIILCEQQIRQLQKFAKENCRSKICGLPE